VLTDAVFSWWMRGLPLGATRADAMTLVQHGFARLRCTGQSNEALFNEPLLLLAFIQYQKNWSQQLSQRFGWTDRFGRNGFKDFLAYYFLHAFDGSHRLNDVLTFREPVDWAKEKFRLVMSINGKFFPVMSTSGYTTSLGSTPSSPEDVALWLHGGLPSPFCFPPKDMGLDLMAVFQNEKQQNLLVIIQGKLSSKHLPKYLLMHGINSVSLNRLWKSKDVSSFSYFAEFQLLIIS
jgi:hypothetical protein